MRETEITVINRNGLGAHTTTLVFDSLTEFIQKVDAIVEEVPFHKVELEFDTDVFTAPEIATLKAEGYVW